MNVAIDVARILAKDRDALSQTDISSRALESLRSAPIEEIILMGRRGPAQAAAPGQPPDQRVRYP